LFAYFVSILAVLFFLGYDVMVNKVVYKTGSSHVLSQCQEFFNFPDVPESILRRKRRFNNNNFIPHLYLAPQKG